ncbi:MAG: hypothetical protein AABZ45_10965 [Pseudomonadota bacterium]
MYKIENGVGNVVAADLQASAAAMENAVYANARLCASLVEGAAQSKLPFSATQAILESVTNSMSKLINSRAELLETMLGLKALQLQTTLRETAFGCPAGCPPLPTSAVQDREPSLVK